ncbi:E3 ubiquitin-protein ligase NEDD4 [Macrophomina phaseolina]|uniref:HECT-type E3 ubiquitin transferase n=1 Tax=Macrophomina phaseolina TaxID=35725 RepID=A0ABQ8FYZ4_9PEZI|nr:E3 ubiquitin-protein ligase NEDD4 [Macrophomina phaseolina]
MFQTFTGSSRRPRQVNLSGRVSNPFAAVGQGQGSQAAVQSAQQERAQRQRERDRLHAARKIQKVWRGHACRRTLYDQIRRGWDELESQADASSPYTSEQDAFLQLQRLLLFMNLRNEKDHTRLNRYCNRAMVSAFTGGPWPMAYLRLQEAVLGTLSRHLTILSAGSRTRAGEMKHGKNAASTVLEDPAVLPSLRTLCFLNELIPKEAATKSFLYYQTVALLTREAFEGDLSQGEAQKKALEALFATVIGPLNKFHANTEQAYEAFAGHYLALEVLSSGDAFSCAGTTGRQWLDQIAASLNVKLLAHSVAELVRTSRLNKYELSTESRVRLLGTFIYCHRHAHNFRNAHDYSSQKDFVTVVSNLLSSVADDVSLDTASIGDGDDDSSDRKQVVQRMTLGPFLQEQITSLVDENSIRGLLADRTSGSLDDDARELASYALTLIRFFPRRGDEIRMWLYLGSSEVRSTPAIKYFWQAVRATSVVQKISHDSKAAIELLKDRKNIPAANRWQAPTSAEAENAKITKEWQVILIFLELYIFVLKVMDDDEFFSGGNVMEIDSGIRSSRTRENALPLADVRDLTIFLKNLGFTMYFNASEILGDDQRDSSSSGGLREFFRLSSTSNETAGTSQEDRKPEQHSIGGITGMSLDYVKGLVTGLLRMVYERDSRRKFLPKDHWLMTSRFDMSGFISAVVEEEENRNRIQEEDDEEGGQETGQDMDGLQVVERQSVIGARRTEQARHLDRLQMQQRKASRKRYLQLVAPRLEILQNMPFFIDFTKRVQIFREFVRLDQMKRRHGRIDPDQWRMLMMHDLHSRDPIERHHAKIRRKNEFEDAFNQFYQLGEALKEPIQITFVDQFDTVEAGIDGGGVTKEFLTSVTSQAFAPAESGIDLFVENDAHLLYPNPSAVEHQKEVLRDAGLSEDSKLFKETVNDLLKRYEFLGRIVGKCLYEGILVDINFAPFFLLKWSLTGGTNSAAKESGYRANLNDLRDLDEDLYQGLLKLKNYPGNVEEDLSLYFTITDVIRKDPRTGRQITVTRELIPDGANIPVTNENRLVYISYVARHRLQIQPHAQTAAFLRGLSTMISPSWLSMFNQSELQTLIGGTSSSIDVQDLRRNTQYGGLYVIGDDGLEHPSVQLFWRVMESLSDDERRAVLKFVTSTPRAPLLGFGSLNPRFSIRDAGHDTSRLPSTSTCVNLLKLPLYKDEQTLREKLLYAVNSGAGFDLS